MDAKTLIEKVGETGEVAELCGVTSAAVSQWKEGVIPPARLMYLKVVRPQLPWHKYRPKKKIEKAMA